eukprot:g19393.t1
MAPSSPSSRKKKRTRRNSSNDGSSSSAAATAPDGGGAAGFIDTGGRGAEKTPRSTSKSNLARAVTKDDVTELATNARGKRRRPVARDSFPHSFPRLDRAATLSPPNRHRGAESRGYAVETAGAGASVNGSPRASNWGGGGGYCRSHSGAASDHGGFGVVAASVSASVSARRLEELFFGGEGDAGGVDGDGGGGVRSGNGAPAPPNSVASYSGFSHLPPHPAKAAPSAECGLFEELTPLGLSGANTKSRRASVEVPLSSSLAGSPAARTPNTKAAAPELSSAAAVASETGPGGKGGLKQEKPRCPRGTKEPANTDRRSTAEDVTNAVAGQRSAAKDAAASAEDGATGDVAGSVPLQGSSGGGGGRGNADMPINVRQGRKEGGCGGGRQNGGGSGLTKNDPSPQVCAAETPPSSPSDHRQPPPPPPPVPSPSANHGTPTSALILTESLARSPPAPSSASPAPDAAYPTAIPETQAPPQDLPGLATRRRGAHGRKESPPPPSSPTASFASIPETQASPEEASFAAAATPLKRGPFRSPSSDAGTGTESLGSRTRTRQSARKMAVGDSGGDGAVSPASIPGTQAPPRAGGLPDRGPPTAAQSPPGRGGSSAKRRRAQQGGGSPPQPQPPPPPSPASSVTIPETQLPGYEQPARCPRKGGRAVRSRSRGKASVPRGAGRGPSPPATGDGDGHGHGDGRGDDAEESRLGLRASLSPPPPPPPPQETSAVSDVRDGREEGAGNGAGCLLTTAGVGVEVGGRSSAEASFVSDAEPPPMTKRVGRTTTAEVAAATAAPEAATATFSSLGQDSLREQQQPVREASLPNGVAPSDSGHRDAVPHAEPPLPGDAGDGARDYTADAGAAERVSAPMRHNVSPESFRGAETRVLFQPSPPMGEEAAVETTVETRTSQDETEGSGRPAPGRQAGGEDLGKRHKDDTGGGAAPGTGAEKSGYTVPEKKPQAQHLLLPQAGEAGSPAPPAAPEEERVGQLADPSTAEGVAAAGGAEGETGTPLRAQLPPTGEVGVDGDAGEKSGGAADNGVDVPASPVDEDYCCQHEQAAGGSQTPSSGAAFDYFPAGYSQSADGDRAASQRGVTAADMLGFQRDLCTELSAPATAEVSRTPSTAPDNPKPPPPAATEEPRPSPSSPSPSSQTLVSRWVPVPNPYAAGTGSLLSPRRKTREAKPLPASPFAIAAEAAARRARAAARWPGGKTAAAVAATSASRSTTATPTAMATATGPVDTGAVVTGTGSAASSPSRARPSAPSPPTSQPKGRTAGVAATSEALHHGHPNPAENGSGERRPGQDAATTSEAEKPSSSTHREAALPAPENVAQPCGASGSDEVAAPPRSGDLAGGNGSPDGASRPAIARPAARSNGFSTARGRLLKVSAEALARVEHIFQEIGSRGGSGKAVVGANHPEQRVGDIPSPGVDPAAAAPAGAVAAPDGHPARGKRGGETKNDAASVLPARGGGFSTARGRPLAISAEALAKVEHLFGEAAAALASADADAVAGGPAAPNAAAAAVSTPRARTTAAAVAAVDPAGGIAQETQGGGGTGVGGDKSTGKKNALDWDAGSSFLGGGRGGGGFQTGRGRALSVSSEALAKVQHLFSGEGDGDSSETRSKGLRAPGSVGAAARHRQATPTFGRKPFRSPAVVGKTRAGDGGGEADVADGGGFKHPAPWTEPPATIPRDAGVGSAACFSAEQGSVVRDRRQEPTEGSSVGPLGAAGVGAPVRVDPVEAAAAQAAEAPAAGASMTGFVTGRGRAVHVSAEALAKASRLLAGGSGGDDDDDDDGVVGEDRSPASAKETEAPPAPCLPHAEPSNSNKSVAAFVGSERDRDDPGAGGAAEKSGRGGRDSEPCLAGPLGGGTSGSSSMFSTGRGQLIEVSTETLARVQAMFRDEPKGDANQASTEGHRRRGALNRENEPFNFKRGGERTGVRDGATFCHSASSEARENSLAPGYAGGGGGVAGLGCGMFSTGSGRRIEVSAEALAQAQKRFGEDEAAATASGTGSGHLPSPLGGGGGSGGNVGRASGDSLLSTGRGKSIEVSPAALSQAYKRFAAAGAEDGDQPSQPSARPPHAPRPTASAASQPAAAMRGFPSPRGVSASGGWCGGAGKENREQRGLPKKRGIGTPSGSFRRLGCTGIAFSPPGRLRGAMPPPAAGAGGGVTSGVATPCSAGKLVGARAAATPSPARAAGGKTAGAPGSAGSAAVPASPSSSVRRMGGGGRASATPQSAAKRRVFSGGYGGGLHATKRSRLSTSAATTTLSASTASPMRALTTPRGLRLSSGGGSSNGNGTHVRGAFPRPSPARLAAAAAAVDGSGAAGLGDVARSARSNHPSTATPVIAAGEEENDPDPDPAGCRASRMLFGNPGSPEKGGTEEAATTDKGASTRKEKECRRRRCEKDHRLPLSSLLDPSPLAPAAELRPQDSSGAVGTGAGGEDGEDYHRLRDKAGASGGEQPRGGLGDADAGQDGQADEEPPPAENDLGSRRAGAVADLLACVTAENACDLGFGDDGRPLCFATPCGSRATPGGEAEAAGQEQGETRRPPKAAPTAFREELVRSGRDGQMATPTWVKNHTRWIVWKLASTERKFPDKFPQGYLLADRVVRQLQYRYDVELDRAKKPCLKAVMQGDASAARPMVLCVSRVFTPEEVGARRGGAAAIVEVTDGWYPMEASLDGALAHFLQKGNKIAPGTKLAVSNASLEAGAGPVVPASSNGKDAPATSNASDASSAMDPLEFLRRRDAGEFPPGAGPRLRLVVNSCRRARWDARLGFFWPLQRVGHMGDAGGAGGAATGEERSALEVPLCTVVPGGGLVSATRVLVLRRYPTLYLSGGGGGDVGGGLGAGGGSGGVGAGEGSRRRVLAEAEEEGERGLHMARMQRFMEKEASRIEEEVMAELEEAAPDSFRRMKQAENPGSLFEALTLEEQREVTDWRERHQQVMEGLRQKAMDERLREMGGLERRVRQLITLRVACVCPHNTAAGPLSTTGPEEAARDGAARARGAGKAAGSLPPAGRRHALPPMVAVLKVWAPNEGTAALLLEGAELRLHSVTASTSHHHVPGCSLELSARRQTKIEVLKAPAFTVSPTAIAAAASAANASRPVTDGPRHLPYVESPGPPTCFRRCVARRCTPLSALAPREAWRDAGTSACMRGGEAVEGGFGRASGGGGRSGSIGGGFPVGVEVDFVGCLFGVTTLQHSPSCSSREVFAAESSILQEEVPAAAAEAAAPPGAASDVYVTYRVYLTDESGACVVLSKRVRAELARHHRILRSAPGACWAIVNAVTGGGDDTESRRRCASPSHSVRGSPSLLCGESRRAETPAVTWSSMTAVGGSGSSPPPRSIGGAPTGHLARPLLALRRWSEGVEGRSAVRRERQRLALLLARSQRCGASAAAAQASWYPSVAAAAATVVGAAAEEGVSTPPSPVAGGGDPGVPGSVAPAAVAAPSTVAARGADARDTGAEARQRGTPGSADGGPALAPRGSAAGSALGFVSSLEFLRRRVPSGQPVDGGERPTDSGDDPPPLWLKVDTGEHLLSLALSKDSLGGLLRVALGPAGDVQPLAVCGRPAAEGPEEERGSDDGDDRHGEGVHATQPRPCGTAQELLARAIAAFGHGDTVGREESTTDYDARRAESKPDAPSSKPASSNWRRDERQPPAPPPRPTASDETRDTAVEALVSAVCALARRERRWRSHSRDGVGGASPVVGQRSATAIAGSVRAEPSSAATGSPGGCRSAAEGAIDHADSTSDSIRGLPSRPDSTVRVATSGNGDAGAVEAVDATASREAGECGSRATAPFDVGGVNGGNGGGSGGGGGTAGSTLLRELAAACGGKQLAFSLTRSFSQVLGHEVRAVECVEAVEVCRAARLLLEDLSDSHLPPA